MAMPPNASASRAIIGKESVGTTAAGPAATVGVGVTPPIGANVPIRSHDKISWSRLPKTKGRSTN
jgi:hypothetical protein